MRMPIDIALPAVPTVERRYVPFGNVCAIQGRLVSPVAEVDADGLLRGFDAAFVSSLNEFRLVQAQSLPLTMPLVEDPLAARLVLGHQGIEAAEPPALYPIGAPIADILDRDAELAQILVRLAQKPKLRAPLFRCIEQTLTYQYAIQEPRDDALNLVLERFFAKSESLVEIAIRNTGDTFMATLLSTNMILRQILQGLLFYAAQDGFFEGWLGAQTAIERATRAALSHARAHGIPAVTAFQNGIEWGRDPKFKAEKLAREMSDPSFQQGIRLWIASRSVNASGALVTMQAGAG